MSGPEAVAWLGSLDLATVRRWGLQGATSILEQAVFSGTNFLAQILLARWLSAEDYGAIAVSFVVILFLSGFHIAFLLEPMSVFGPAKYQDALRSYLLTSLRIHLLLTAPLGLALLVGGVVGRVLLGSPEAVAAALVGAGLALPFILWAWLARRSAYVIRQPNLALRGSVAYLVLNLVLLGTARIAGWITISPIVPYAIMALASLIAGGVTLTLVIHPGQGRARVPGPDARQVLRENWRYGRWGAASGVLNSTAGQLQTVALAFAGLAEAGALRAMQNFMLPMAQTITSIAQMSLPALARDFGEGRLVELKRKGLFVCVVLTFVALTYAALLLVLRGPLEQLAYGGKFAAYSGLIPLLGLVPVFSGLGTGISLILRAVQWPQHALYVTSVSGMIGLVSAVLLTWGYGITGAAISVVITYAVASGVALFLFIRRKDHLDRVSMAG